QSRRGGANGPLPGDVAGGGGRKWPVFRSGARRSFLARLLRRRGREAAVAGGPGVGAPLLWCNERSLGRRRLTCFRMWSTRSASRRALAERVPYNPGGMDWEFAFASTLQGITMDAFRALAGTCLLLLVLTGRAGGQEWTRFRGPNGSGLS